MPPEDGKKGWKRERVLALHLEGKSKVDIASYMDISPESVSTHLSVLRRQGRLPSRGTSSSSDDLQHHPAPSGEESSDDDDDGDSVQDLREEVARQQGGDRNKTSRLAVVTHDEHEHVAVVDRMGDGQTTPDPTGHQHKIYRFVVGGALGEDSVHRHGLLAKEPEA